MKLIRFKQFLREGGNVFQGTDKIPKGYIQPTLKEFFKELSIIFPKHKDIFNLNYFKPLGSVGKKDHSGDIDLAIDVKTLISDKTYSEKFLSTWKISKSEFESKFQDLKKRSKTSTEEMNKEKAFLMLITKELNKSGTIEAHEKKVTNGNIFTNFPQYNENGEQQNIGVQIDFMIGNLEWLTFSYYSDEYKDNVKGLHRTQFLVAMYSAKDKTFSHVNGVKDKESGQLEAKTPKEALDLLNSLYKLKITESILQNYHKLFDYFSDTVTTSEKNKVYDIYLKILDSTRADIPENLQDYWIKNKDRLNLTGKFLPDDSKLNAHLSESYLNESGVVQPDRIDRKVVAQTLKIYNTQVLSKIKGVESYNLSGSINSDASKMDFGDIDLIVHISAKDKTEAKERLIAEFEKNPYIIEFEYKGKKKKYYNAGELVTIKFKQAGSDKTVQIDNIIALTKEEMNFKNKFLDIAAEKQGLLLGLIKVAITEFPEKFKGKEGLDFDLSPVSLRLRDGQNQNQYLSQNWEEVEQILSFYGLKYDDSFDKYLKVVKTLSRRSIDRIKGLFKKMITIKSGEVGTPKGNKKQETLDIVDKL